MNTVKPEILIENLKTSISLNLTLSKSELKEVLYLLEVQKAKLEMYERIIREGRHIISN